MTTPARLVTFRWNSEEWAFDVDDVVEVASARPITPLPRKVRGVLGLVAWRGKTLPVVGPRCLKDPPAPPDLRRRLLVLRRPAPFAVPVDEPGRVIDVGAWSPPPGGEAAGVEGGAVRGVAEVAGGAVRVLDPAALLGREAGPRPDEGARAEEDR